VISSLEFINFWLTVWLRGSGVGLHGDRQACNTLIFLMWKKKTFSLLSEDNWLHAYRRFSAFERWKIRLRLKISQKSRSHHEILGAKRVMQNNFHFADPRILGATGRSPWICAPLNMPLCVRFEVVGYWNMNELRRSFLSDTSFTRTANCGTKCVISGFCHGVNGTYVVLGFYAA
jgi:hypothetical protein